MRKKFITAVLPVLAATAIVGAGFSAWIFDASLDSENINGTVEIAPLGDVSLSLTWCDSSGAALANQDSPTFAVTLDQGGKGNTSADVGISVVTTSGDGTTQISNEGKLYFKVTYTAGSGNTATINSVDYDWNIALDSVGYVALKGTTGADNIAAGSSVDAAALVTVDLSMKYVNKPTDASSWKSLSESVLADSDIVATISFENIDISYA